MNAGCISLNVLSALLSLSDNYSTGCCYLNFMSISSYVQAHTNTKIVILMLHWDYGNLSIHFSPLITQSIRRTNTFMRLNVNTLHNFLPYCHNFHHHRNRQIIKGKVTATAHTYTHTKYAMLGNLNKFR